MGRVEPQNNARHRGPAVGLIVKPIAGGRAIVRDCLLPVEFRKSVDRPRRRGDRMIAKRAAEGCWRGFGLKAALLLGLLITSDHRASADETARIVRTGVLASAEQHPIQSFRERLHELGWIEGKNVRFDYRWAQADDTRHLTEPGARGKAVGADARIAARHNAGRHAG